MLTAVMLSPNCSGLQTQAQSTEKAFGALQSAIGALGVGFALTKVIADVKELDTNLRRLGTVGGNVAALDKGLGALSDRLGGVANKAELAAASYQALSAGFTETGANLRVVEAATKAAVGGLVDVTAATEVTTKVLNAYNMSGDQATKVTDSIAKSIEYGVIQWSDYTSQLGRVASVSAIAGVSLDEVNAFISSATKNSATAEIAFTGLGATLSNMLKPTKESADAAKALGINWNLSGIRGEGFESLMGKLGKAMQKNPVLANKMVGGQEAVRGAFAAASKGGKDYAMILEGLGGAADKTDADFQTMKGSLENTLKALDTSFKNLSEALGTAFGPTVVIAIQDITKAVNSFADFMAMVPQPVMDTAGEIVKLIIQLLLVEKALKIAMGTAALFRGAMLLLTTQTTLAGAAALTGQARLLMLAGGIKGAGVAAATATPAMLGLLTLLLRLAAIGAIAIVVNIAVTGMAALLQASAEIAKLRGERTQKGGPAANFGGSITPQQRAENEKTLAAIEKEKKSPKFKAQQASAALGIGKIFGQSRADILLEREIATRAKLALPTRKEATPTPTPTPITATGAGNDDAKRAAEKKRRAAEELANLQGQVTLKEKLFGIDKQIAVEKERGSLVTAAALEMDKALEERQTRIAEITRSTADTATKNAQIKDATLEADEKIFAVQQAIKEQEAERTKSFDAIIADLNLELALKTATTEQERERLRIEAARAKLQADLKGQGFQQPQIDQITGLQAQVAAPLTDVQKIDQHIGKLKDEIADLTSISNIAITSAEGIGKAFAQSFQGLISGSMTAKEALSSFFKSVADMFLEMAAQIIAKQMTMIILQTILKALGAVGGGGGGGGGTVTGDFMNTEALKGFTPAANGATFANGIAKFASGGIVSSPTLFKFADGGTTRTGLMGEAGPEAIMPLKRGADGSLGVQANGLREAMNQDRAGGSGSPVLNMSFQSTSINGTEYVSRDQLEQAMAQTRRDASRDGAKRGMSMTLDKLQQSPSTRSRVGMR
jgi:TP901 family phage tail tape measure protein/lambda family phage tail tape measure protein